MSHKSKRPRRPNFIQYTFGIALGRFGAFFRRNFLRASGSLPHASLILVPICLLSVLFPPNSARPTDLSVLLAFMYKPACDRIIPNYKAENSTSYEAWNRAHKAEMEQIEREPGLQAKREQILSKIDSSSATERIKIEEHCSDLTLIRQ
jgi:hypothetical protein